MNRDEWTPSSSFSASQEQVKTCLRESCRATRTSHWGRGPDGPQTLCNICYMQYSQKKLTLYQDGSTGKLSVRARPGWYAVRITGFPLLRPEKGLFGPGLRRRQRDLSKPIVVPLHEEIVDLDSGPPQILPQEQRRGSERRERRVSTSSDDNVFLRGARKKGKPMRLGSFARPHLNGKAPEGGTTITVSPQDRDMVPMEETDDFETVTNEERIESTAENPPTESQSRRHEEENAEQRKSRELPRRRGTREGGRRTNGSNFMKQVSIKAEYQGSLRRLRVPQGVSFRAFYKDLGNLFGVVHQFVIMYQDEEGDFVTLASDRDMVELFHLIKEHEIRLLRVKLAPKVEQDVPIAVE